MRKRDKGEKRVMILLKKPSNIKINMNEMYPHLYRNARPNNYQLITYYQCVSYLLRIQQYPVNNTY